MKRIFYLITLFSILSTSSYAQWWVDGGNLLWPYGDVSIKKNLNVDGTVSFDSSLSVNGNLTIAKKLYLKGYDFSIYNYEEVPFFDVSSQYIISLGDVKGWINRTKFVIDDNYGSITSESYINNIRAGIVNIGDYNDGNYGTEINLDDDNGKIILDADSSRFTGNLLVNGNLSAQGTFNGAQSYYFLFTHDGGTGNPSVVDLFNNIGSHDSWVRTGVGVFRTIFTDLTFDNNRVFNTRSVTIDNGDTKIHYVTYTSGSYLYLQITNFETISEYEPMLTRLPVSLIYYP